MPGTDLRQGRDATLAATNCACGCAQGRLGSLFTYHTSPYSPLREKKAMTSSTSAVREPTRIVTAHRQREGAGFIGRRPVPTPGMDEVDSIPLLDEMGAADYGPSDTVADSAPPH